MMRRLLMAISGRLPCRIISDANAPYLERYYLCTVFGVCMYLHRFVGSDPDRGLHDHPWPWAVALVLSGFYIEERRGNERDEATPRLAGMLDSLHIKPEGVVRRRVRWLNLLTGDSFHRVILPRERDEVWTLFAHRATNVKSWGFIRPIKIDDLSGHVWSPYSYPGGKDKQWWKSAPVGKFCTRRKL